ncbi:DNA polymerase IV [Paenalkalicoccus suaedae]|uniref:DNA polymerase IV n=2 Tax=Paenalkalicoccus suaedae TaxID=2592382 RepID=A0A859FE18_9BACI|nr:DNA polymerase IV [Paenalkalicoccus suaedae]
MKKSIFLIDMQSFFASVEKAKIPHAIDKPLVVSGDPSRRSGVILAACPLAKRLGVENGERLFDAQQKCPDLMVVAPHMQDYIDHSLAITEILEAVTDLVEPYSIDEQFMDVTHSQKLFGTPLEIAKYVQGKIFRHLGVRARIGIGENKVLAKMACDTFAKKNEEGIFTLTQENIEEVLWPRPINDLFRAGAKMTRHLRVRGVQTIGDFAAMSPEDIRKRFGIHGQVLWMNARGVDYSPVSPHTMSGQKAIGNGMTLPRDYTTKRDIKLVLLELCEEVCRRAREGSLLGQTISVGVTTSYELRTGFHRQMTMERPTAITMEVFAYVCKLFDQHWNGLPVRRLHISLSKLSSDKQIQLSLFDDGNREKHHKLGYVMDTVNKKYGKTSLIRASSLQEASQVKERAAKIGGHYK